MSPLKCQVQVLHVYILSLLENAVNFTTFAEATSIVLALYLGTRLHSVTTATFQDLLIASEFLMVLWCSIQKEGEGLVHKMCKFITAVFVLCTQYQSLHV